MADSSPNLAAPSAPATTPGRGLAYALGAHVAWGSMPLYLLLVKSVPALEFVAWRLIFTLPLCLAIMLAVAGFGELAAVLRDKKAMLALLGSSALIAINWYIYVEAINTGHVFAASLGYYILPLVMMLLGLTFLGEKLSRIQWAAVALAGAGVAALASGALSTLWLSLSMGLSFGLYGLLRKTVKAGPLAGLTVEVLLLSPIAFGLALWYAASPQGTALAQGWQVAGAVALSGPMTAIPLLMFASATRALPYTVIGFLQFLSPTVVFLMGLFVFDEELKPAQLACFVAIWAAAGLFTVGLLRKPKTAAVAVPAETGQ